MGTILSEVVSRCKKALFVCLACRESLSWMRRGDVSTGWRRQWLYKSLHDSQWYVLVFTLHSSVNRVW
jgi:hypothetical protein